MLPFNIVVSLCLILPPLAIILFVSRAWASVFVVHISFYRSADDIPDNRGGDAAEAPGQNSLEPEFICRNIMSSHSKMNYTVHSLLLKPIWQIDYKSKKKEKKHPKKMKIPSKKAPTKPLSSSTVVHWCSTLVLNPEWWERFRRVQRWSWSRQTAALLELELSCCVVLEVVSGERPNGDKCPQPQTGSAGKSSCDAARPAMPLAFAPLLMHNDDSPASASRLTGVRGLAGKRVK